MGNDIIETATLSLSGFSSIAFLLLGMVLMAGTLWQNKQKHLSMGLMSVAFVLKSGGLYMSILYASSVWDDAIMQVIFPLVFVAINIANIQIIKAMQLLRASGAMLTVGFFAMITMTAMLFGTSLFAFVGDTEATAYTTASQYQSAQILRDQIADTRAEMHRTPDNQGTNRDKFRAALQADRAALAAITQQGGAGTQAQAYRADVRIMAGVFGITLAQANARISGWYSFILDILGMALLMMGIALRERKTEETTQTLPPAQTIPALLDGGRITGDGVAEIHTGEIVLNPVATHWMDDNFPGLMDKLNAGAPPTALTPALTPAPTPASAPISAPIVSAPASALASKTPRASALTGAPSDAAMQEMIKTAKARIIYKNAKRVEPHMSQIAGKNRQGKIDQCINTSCGSDYMVKAYNQLKCRACSRSASAGFTAKTGKGAAS